MNKLYKLPEYTREITSGSDGLPRWCAKNGPPAIGTNVVIKLNGWDNAKGFVVGYNTDAGWLMIIVQPKTRPAWHMRDNPDRTECLFAGNELEYATIGG